MSTLGVALAEYLDLRRSLGYRLEQPGRVLPRFVTELDDQGIGVVSVAFALEWSTRTPVGASQRLEAVRGFARYLQALDPRHEIPPTRLIPHPNKRVVVHIYSNDEIAALMTAAATIRPTLRADTIKTMVGLLAVTGMRIGEVLALETSDIDWDRGTITVKDAKFDKKRHVPVSTCTLAALNRYRDARNNHAREATTPVLFVQHLGRPITYGYFKRSFDVLLQVTGLAANGNRRPRVHDLRHSFAVSTLIRWYDNGADIGPLLPVLSTYLGHINPASTYWYLTGTPELLAVVAARLEHHEDTCLGGAR